jgi:serine/threonine protein kinase
MLVWQKSPELAHPARPRLAVPLMESSTTKPRFQTTAVASGLVTKEELNQALESMRAQTDQPGPRFKDEQIAAKLIEMGKLNYYLAEQLLAGRSKFTLGPYRVLDSIGQGGMGQVFKAEHSIMRRVVAIKVLPRSKSTPRSVADFIREIQVQAQLDHPNLVRAYDAGQDGEVHFLVTEYVPGTDLRRFVRRHGRLTMRAAATIITQAARGLEHAHARSLIHRDVKPGNLLVTPESLTKVSDLGLAGFFGDEVQVDSREGKIVGTADYLSPEQILTPDKLTPACDVYALGCTLYYAVTTKVPFPGGTTQEKARSHCRLQPIDPRRINPDLEDDFVDVIAAMMVKDPAERLQSMRDVIGRLAPWAASVDELAEEGLESWIQAPPTRLPKHLVRGADGIDLGETRPMPQPADELEEVTDESDQLSQISQISQGSQGTVPLAAAYDETMPVFDRPFDPPVGGSGGMTPGVLILVVIGLATAVGALGAIFLLMLLT